MSIEELCIKWNIENYTINDDGSIDVDGDIDISEDRFTNISIDVPLKFNKVTGDFVCRSNYLTTLEGSPKSVGGGFYCDYNKLTSLKGCSESIGNHFVVNNNNLKNIDFIPDSMGGLFKCSGNLITNIFVSVNIDFLRAFKTFKVLNDGVVNLKRLRYVMEIFDIFVDLGEIKKHYTIK